MEIRKIRPEEREEALSVMKDAFDPSYESIFFLYEPWCLVAVEDGRILAGTNSDIFTLPNGKKIGYIGWLYTSAGARGMGLASKLTEAMLDFLREEGCDDVLAIVEGDNPSSFKLFSEHLSIMPLHSQIKSFGLGIFKVWKRSSHFFDSGYFVWHDGKGLSLDESNSASFWLYLILNMGLLTGWLFLKGVFSPVSFAVPLTFLILRPIIMRLSLGWNESIFLPWDTWPLFSLVSLLLPFYVPTPLGVYIKGRKWSVKDNALRLAKTGTITLIFELFFLSLTGNLTVCLPFVIADSLLAFYPFCGYQASRIKRVLGRKFKWVSLSSIIIAAASVLSRYAF